MPWTLLKYIFREMGKSFLLTAVGLMGLLGLGGGVLNMIELEGVTAGQLLKIMVLILPVSAALTLPIAALYSATVTYGRLSADNELVACRSAGINIHILLLPTLVISLVSALCSFFFINFLIPGMVKNIDRLVGSDLPRIIRQKLVSPERLSLNRDKYCIYADQSELVMGDETEGGLGPSELRLKGVAFLEMDKEKWSRFGTAQSVTIRFDTQSGVPAIEGNMRDLSFYDFKGGRWIEQGSSPIERYQIPQTVPLRIKWLDLGDLLYYQRQPSLFPDIEEGMGVLRAGIARAIFYRRTIEQFKTTGEIRFGDDKVRYTVTAKQLRRGLDDNRPMLEGGVTVIEQWTDGHRREITANHAAMMVDRSRGERRGRVYLQADGNVSIVDSRRPDRTLRRQRERFSSVTIKASILDMAMAHTDEALLAADSGSLGLGKWVDKRRTELIEEVDEVRREITGVLHSRLAFSTSVFVLVILGAVLGIVLRGSHALTAFGISFVPSVFVISTIIMGRQLVESTGTSPAIGVLVIWSGIVLVAGLDAVIMTKVLRR